MRSPYAKVGALGLVFLYLMGLGFFYIKYVPLVLAFQVVLAPVLAAVAVLTAADKTKGLLAFVFVFPLINNLPYFFGITEPLPHAPTALVLFLFYFLGWIIHRTFVEAGEQWTGPLRRPLVLPALLIVLSAAVTFFRYSNFFPFQSDGLYELVVNTQGVTAGGAFMSIVFTVLNYLGGFGFYLAFTDTVKSESLRKKVLTVLSLSVFLSLAFGFVQSFYDIRLGNNPLSIASGIINATFKDALSFGCFLSMAVPIFLGVVAGFRGAVWRILAGLVISLSFFLILSSGSKSSLAGLAAALLYFLIMAAGRLHRQRLVIPVRRRRYRLWGATVLALLLVAAILMTRNRPFLGGFKSARTVERLEKAPYMLNLRLETLWKTALFCLADYPFTGVGLGAYIIESANYASLHGIDIGVSQSAENYFLQVASELGAAGLLLFLWIFWMIARRIRAAFLSVPEGSPDRWLLIGATSGLLAYLVNIQVHSYIGSYEITFAFWLLVGLIFSMGQTAEGIRDEDAGPGRRGAGRRFTIFAAAFLALFSAVHLWNSLHSLSLTARMRNFGISQEFGLDRPEHTADGREFRWTRSYAGIPLQVVKPVLSIPLHCSHPDIEKNPVRVRIFWTNDFFKHRKLLREIVLARGDWQEITILLTEEVGQEGILFIKVSRTWTPLKVTGAPDPRNLGVAVGRISWHDF